MPYSHQVIELVNVNNPTRHDSPLQTFLASMKLPLSVPDNKLTRWHPNFKVDEVPNVEPAELPQSPDVKKFSSAKDVLAHTSNLNPRVCIL